MLSFVFTLLERKDECTLSSVSKLRNLTYYYKSFTIVKV
jgi:hypothetical protein